jgi:hypothetical protein
MKKIFLPLLILFSFSLFSQTDKPIVFPPQPCSVLLFPPRSQPQKLIQPHPAGYSAPVTIYVEIDFALYNYLGGTTAQCSTYYNAWWALIAEYFHRDSVIIAKGGLKIWTIEDNYGRRNGANGFPISEFGEAMIITPPAHADVAMLLSRSLRTSGGISYLGGLCFGAERADNTGWGGRVCIVDYIDGGLPQPFGQDWDLYASLHELGHLIGNLPHTHSPSWCGNNSMIDSCGAASGYGEGGTQVCQGYQAIPSIGGTFLSYCHTQAVGINMQGGYGTEPRERMLDFISASDACLVYHNQSCTLSLPTNRTVTNITSTTATFNWSSNIEDYFWISYTKIGSGVDVVKQVPGNQNTIGISGLTPNSQYGFKVKAFCNGATSGYQPTKTLFTTLPGTIQCGIPQNISISQITSTSAFVQWDLSVSAPAFIVWYQENGHDTKIRITSHTATLSNLISGHSYKLRVRSDCPGAIYSSWSSPFTPQ